MLSKNKIKYIRSLDLKKMRNKDRVFVAEGPKLVDELLPSFECLFLAATEDYLRGKLIGKDTDFAEVTQEELQRTSFLKTPQEVVAVFRQPDYPLDLHLPETELCLALDDVQDPGNLNTIVRIADWFGIRHIFCSAGTADIYNPKTVQATMGAIARVKLHYLQLTDLFTSLSSDVRVFGTFLDGKNIYSEDLSETGLIVMGNEGNGISREVERFINQRLYIPNYPQGEKTSESLNVAVATAVTCAEFRRRFMK